MGSVLYDMERRQAATLAERMEDLTGFAEPIDDHLDAIDTPTLVIVGGHDEKLLVDAAHYLADRLSDQDAVVIGGAAHLPPPERPGVFNATLSGFLVTL